MKRLITILGLVLLLAVLALPAVAQADNRGPAPTGWTWDEIQRFARQRAEIAFAR